MVVFGWYNWVEAREAAQCPTTHRTAPSPHLRVIRTAVALRLRNLLYTPLLRAGPQTSSASIPWHGFDWQSPGPGPAAPRRSLHVTSIPRDLCTHSSLGGTGPGHWKVQKAAQGVVQSHPPCGVGQRQWPCPVGALQPWCQSQMPGAHGSWLRVPSIKSKLAAAHVPPDAPGGMGLYFLLEG